MKRQLMKMAMVLLGAGCSAPPVTVDAGPEGQCQVVTRSHPIEGANHVATCSSVSFGSLPPSSGNHYPTWAAYKTYTASMPPGFLVHNLEHGALVFTYNCPAGCDDELAALQKMIDALPADTVCGSRPARRVVVAPDPALDVRFAVAAWGFTLRAACFDEALFKSFAIEHAGRGPESTCADGADIPALIATMPECQWWFARDAG